MKHLIVVLNVLFIFQAQAADWEQNAKVAELFTSANVDGTFVLYDVTAERFIGHNQVRANKRFVPASTFKIPHTLIGLAVGAVSSVDEVLPYGGKPQPFKAWEKDMSLQDAITISNVAIYQTLAQRIGAERMGENISKLDFGNAETGSHIEDFWLKGPLKVSAVEQTLFLAKLAKGTLQFNKTLQQSVRDIIRLEQMNNVSLYAKTGWQNAPGQGVGWWVGWVEKNDRVYAFALNIDIVLASDATKRVELGKASLSVLGVL